MTFNHLVIQNILRDKWTYISYFLSSVFSILVFFFFDYGISSDDGQN